MSRHSAWLEVYSIDEAFLGLRGTYDQLQEAGQKLQADILKLTGLPVGIGIAKTKTLAKLANHAAKHFKHLDGVCVWDAIPTHIRDQLLTDLPAGDIWGIGARTATKLQAMGITTAHELALADPHLIRQRFSVVQMRTVLEMQGTPCIPMEEERVVQDQLMYSRSFSQPVTTEQHMQQVLNVYTQQAAARLHSQKTQAKTLTAWAHTSAFKPEASHQATVTVSLPDYTADPFALTQAAQQLLPKIVPGMQYVKAGISVTQLRAQEAQQTFDLFQQAPQRNSMASLLADIRQEHGSDVIGLGQAGVRRAPEWEMKRDMMSQRYTTHWDEVMTVHA